MNPTGSFRDRISAKVQSNSHVLQSERPLGIAVLGPRLANSDTPGARKRRQIYEALKQEGHKPFYPEDLVAGGTRRVLAEERDILSHDSVDWIILLHTEEGRGTLLEIGYFSNYPEIIKKTTLFFPKDFYNPDENLAANTVEGFWSPPVPHTQEHLASCSVVAECKDMAAVRLQCEATFISVDLDTPLL